MRSRRTLVSLLAAATAAAVLTAVAFAHVERASYYPDPGPDRGVSPAAGGSVPDARSLYTALDSAPPGTTRVVCQGAVPSQSRVKRLTRRLRRARRRHASLTRRRVLRRRLGRARRSYRRAVRRNPSIARLRDSVYQARQIGFKLRPSESPRHLTRREDTRLLRFNERLLARCRYDSIQAAIFRSGNNDRVVVLPGTYTEPQSRAQPRDDPKCDDLEERNDRNDSQALSYPYQVKCPNDQNLIAIMGRSPGPGKDPQPPRFERRGIPNLGPCVRCNVQLEGSGVAPDDVVVDSGNVKAGDDGPSGEGSKKDIGIRADRADGFVLRNMKIRHSHEHTVYVTETDGYRLERIKTYYPGDYGVLTFVSDHGVIQDCEAKGAGDAGVYPGAAADTGEQTVEPRQRYNQELRDCDLHHNTLGFSGTNGNAVHVHHNRFYDNALGLSADVFTAAGHPGFPTDTLLVENNYFYSNNFNPYRGKSDVEPRIPAPVGTGLWFPGGNNHDVRNNHFWDNWRRGTMLFSVPDAFVCGPGTDNEQEGCSASQVSTSHRNRFHNNVMGRAPDGKRDPNGVDFWWDQFADNRNNCWYDNTGKDGNAASVTSEPSSLPSNCETSRGTGGAGEAELMRCLADITFETDSCGWYATPPEPK